MPKVIESYSQDTLAEFNTPDKKIAFIELSKNIEKRYLEDIAQNLAFIGEVVAEFGEEKFNQMYELFDAFIELAKKRLKETRQNGK